MASSAAPDGKAPLTNGKRIGPKFMACVPSVSLTGLVLGPGCHVPARRFVRVSDLAGTVRVVGVIDRILAVEPAARGWNGV